MPSKLAENWKAEPDDQEYATSKKVRDGKKPSPALLVRGQLASDVPLTVADGYHRICASHHFDEDADIPCHVVDLASR
jgi:hypothetical protein